MSKKTSKRTAVNALCRSNLFTFTRKAFEELHPNKHFHAAKHIKLLCKTLQDMLDHPGEHHLMMMPPRYAKSFVASICFVAWVLGKNPSLKFLVVSYGDALAVEHAAAFRDLITSDWYKGLFPHLNISINKAGHIKTDAGGGRYAVSVGGAATGFGADFIIIDDIIKAGDVSSEAKREEAIRSLNETFFSRLDKKSEGHIIAIQQRLHEDDPAAYMATKNFKQLCLKAIAEEDEEWDLGDETWVRKRGEPLYPELENLQTLEAVRATMSASVFSAQYQQNPVNIGGNRISWQRIGFYKENYQRNNYLKIIQSWDTACTNEPTSDYSACVTMGCHISGKWHVLDVHRGRYEFSELETKALHMIHAWDPHCVLIETAAGGHALVSRLKLACSPNRPNPNQRRIWGINHRESKEDRVFINQAELEEQRALLPDQAPWLDDLRKELLAFPVGRHDDQVDALFQIFHFLQMPRGRGFMNRDPVTGRSPGSRTLRRQA